MKKLNKSNETYFLAGSSHFCLGTSRCACFSNCFFITILGFCDSAIFWAVFRIRRGGVITGKLKRVMVLKYPIIKNVIKNARETEMLNKDLVQQEDIIG